MGKQINFYLAPNDIRDLEQRISKSEPIIFLHDRSPKEFPRIVNSLQDEENGHRWLFYYLVRKSDLSKILMKYVATQNYWSIDELRSPVIEVNVSFFDGNSLGPGRVFYQERYYDKNGNNVEKSNDFKKWAKSVFYQTKKGLTKEKKDLRYKGKQAKELADSGKIILRPN